jgi:hypothetical protein
MRGFTYNAQALVQWASVSSSLDSDYNLDNAAHHVTPDQVTSSTPGDEAILIALLFEQKSTLYPPAPIYQFNISAIKG